MTADLAARYQRLLAGANDYHKRALWQEKLRLLQEALTLCEDPEFPDADVRRQELLFDLGGIWRRLGQYERAEEVLKQSLDVCSDTGPLKRAAILGELAVVFRHRSMFAEAQSASRQQFEIAQDAAPSLEAEAEMCRAIGNEGMSAYNLSQMQRDENSGALLEQALRQMHERVRRARELQQHVLQVDPESPLLDFAKAWETIGLDRLSLLHIAAGQFEDAVKAAEESQARQSRVDPTVTAFSKFFYGHALWHNGQREEALEQWNAPLGVCNSPTALCKEPTQEHTEWLRLMADAGVDFDSYDEQGFSALDYAVLSSNPDSQTSIPIILEALRKAISKRTRSESAASDDMDISARVDHEVALRQQQAEVRRQYRIILQERIRPELRAKSKHTFQNLRSIYAKFLQDGSVQQRVLNDFHFVKYTQFLDHGRLPISTDRLTTTGEEDFVIFISYRWLWKDNPDDGQYTQWKRILDAVECFLRLHPHIKPDQLGLWVDYACIDQVDEAEKARGIDALPLAVTLCNAMISLVDDTYYERAWCAVEVVIIRTVMESYGLHQWWEHVLDSPHRSLSTGSLRKAGNFAPFNLDDLKLSDEKSDRPKVDFLMRQSKLLGKDDA